jgi:cytoskeletal protein RodZ
MPEVVDQIARDSARDAVHAVANFRMVTEGEFKLVNAKIETTHKDTGEKIDKIESAIKWAGGLIVSLMLTVLGWAVLQQINANESQKKEMAQQIELLQQQENARVQARSEILSRLPPGTTDAEGLSEAGNLRDGRSNGRR